MSLDEETERTINNYTKSRSTLYDSINESRGIGHRTIIVSDFSDEGHPREASQEMIDNSTYEIMQCASAADSL